MKYTLEQAYAKIKMNELLRVPQYLSKVKIGEINGIDCMINVLPAEYSYWDKQFYGHDLQKVIDKKYGQR